MNIFGRKILIQRIRLDRDGYTQMGRYYGVGLPLFMVFDDDSGRQLFIRATDRARAVQAVKLEDTSNPSYGEIKYFWDRINAEKTNPLAPQTRNVLLGVAALGALGALFYAINASAKSTSTASGGSGGGGSLNFLIPTGAIDVGTADSGTTIPVGVGQSVVITVPNADPGYTWKIGYAGPNVMGSPKGDSSSGELVELYTVQLTGQQTITFTQLDMNGNINPNNGEYTFTFTSTLTNPVGGNKSGV